MNCLKGRLKWKYNETLQILNSYDMDGDGQDGLIVTYSTNDKKEIELFSSELFWMKMILSSEREVSWKTGMIGTGYGDWPHGSFTPFKIVNDFAAARLAFMRFAWLECPENPEEE